MIQSTLFKFFVFWPDPTHQPTQPPTHPPNHTPIHGWRIFYRFQIFKRNWNILISSSVIEFLLILGCTPLGGWRMGGWEWGWAWVCGGCPMHTYMHTHAHARMHTRTCMLNMLIMLNMDASMLAAICNFYTCIHVCMCMCVRAHACACVGGHPPCPQIPPDTPPPPVPSPEPQGAQNSKIQ